MKRKPIYFIIYLTIIGSLLQSSAWSQQLSDPLRVNYPAEIQDAFWSPKFKVWDSVTTYDVLNKFEGRHLKTAEERAENNVFANFDKIAAGKKGTEHHAGLPWFDGLIYESIRGIGDLLAQHPDPKLQARVDGYIDRIYAAQQADSNGYLDTYTDLMEPGHRWGDHGGLLRFQHDVYNAGMLIEAGVHYYKATGKTKLLEVATRFANYMTRLMGPAPKRNIIPAHAGPEEALMKLYLLYKSEPELKKQLHVPVDEASYYALTRFWIENRGHHIGYPLWQAWGNDSAEHWIKDQKYMEMAKGPATRPTWGSYAQDSIPVFQQKTIEGHAVRATLLGTGIASVAIENQDPEYIQTATRFWDNMVGRRMFVTGGVGAIADDEKFGADYYLPTGAYLETCAAVGAGFFSQRMNELTGNGKYMDEFERVLYNNVLTGISLSGDQYTYQNPLNAHNHSRWEWHSCPCCPPMFLKMVSALPDFIYATAGDALYVNMFIGSNAKVNLTNNRTVAVTQKTEYPWKGKIELKIDPSKRSSFDLKIRIPGWARGIENPYDLYEANGGGGLSLQINGQPEKMMLRDGYAVINRTWHKGDRVTLELPMKPRFVSANPKVKDLKAMVAIACGPMIYCLENADNGPVDRIEIDTTSALQVQFQPAILNGVNVIEGKQTEGGSFTAIPYYAVGNRSTKGYMVWLPVAKDAEIRVNSLRVENKISPQIYGANLEDVNHEIYGGLYDQRIFGESFEEPVTGLDDGAWRKYAGYWTAKDGVATIIPGRATTSEVEMNGKHQIGVEPDHSAKLVYQPLEFTNGSVEAEMRFTGPGESGALLVKVDNAGVGDDVFDGYEISLSGDGKKVAVGKHRQNFESIKEAQVNFNPADWNQLKVNFDGPTIEVLLNNKIVLTCQDADERLLKGKIGLRTWHSAMQFRKISVQENHQARSLRLMYDQPDQISHRWDAVRTHNVDGSIDLDSSTAFNGRQSEEITFSGGSGNIGVANQGLNRWGIAVRQNQQFQGRVYLKGKHMTGPVHIALESADGKKTYAVRELNHIEDSWKKYPFKMTADATDPNARLAIYLSSKGKIWVDQVVLMGTGKDQFKGLPVRADIGQMLIDQGLKFLRYAGTMVNSPEYRFKDMIGDPDKRPPYRGHWNQYSSNGFGIEEFLKFCEAAAIEPCFAINIYETPQDVANMVEYLNGDITTAWGAKRAQNGHPDPYGVNYIEIGNEEVIFNGDDKAAYQEYVKRFELLYQAMKAKDKHLKFVHSAFWRQDSPNMEFVFRALDGKADYWDLHVGGDNTQAGVETDQQLRSMDSLFKKWDPNTIMKVAVFEENGGKHGIQRALGHATNMNAIRRHSEFVLTSTPANALQPFHQNDNDWDQGQVFFTQDQVWGMPPFYAQQMQAAAHLPLRVQSSVNDSALDVTATRNARGDTLMLHVVNTSPYSIHGILSLNGFEGRKPEVDIYELSGPLEGINTPQEPSKYVTKSTSMPLKEKQPGFNFKAGSYTILRFCK